MRVVKVSRMISSSADAVWDILTDRQRLVAESFGIVELEGAFGLGEKIKLRSEVAPDRAFDLVISEFDPTKQMVWRGGLPLGLFVGERKFTLESHGLKTEFHMREKFSGILSPLIFKSMPNLQPSFEKFASTLKSLAEEDAL